TEKYARSGVASLRTTIGVAAAGEGVGHALALARVAAAVAVDGVAVVARLTARDDGVATVRRTDGRLAGAGEAGLFEAKGVATVEIATATVVALFGTRDDTVSADRQGRRGGRRRCRSRRRCRARRR